jgi:SAM-dependent methyltransferase
MESLGPKLLLNAVHNSTVFSRRVRVLAGHLADAVPGPGRVLDLGSGDGSIAAALMKLRPDLSVEGVDVMVRPRTQIPVTSYDGVTLPFGDASFDYVTIVDVLHHTTDPAAVLTEAARVARQGIVLKDHLLEGFLAGPTLCFMDWVGNRGHGVVLPYNYLSRYAWQKTYRSAGLALLSSNEALGLYPAPFSWFFDRRLHFVAFLARR